jgi:excisionase family DNA binding protein
VSTTTWLSPSDVAQQLNVHVRTVSSWIHTGQLKATNLGRAARLKKPRFRVLQKDLDEFLRHRSPVARVKKVKRDEVVLFYR